MLAVAVRCACACAGWRRHAGLNDCNEKETRQRLCARPDEVRHGSLSRNEHSRHDGSKLAILPSRFFPSRSCRTRCKQTVVLTSMWSGSSVNNLVISSVGHSKVVPHLHPSAVADPGISTLTKRIESENERAVAARESLHEACLVPCFFKITSGSFDEAHWRRQQTACTA